MTLQDEIITIHVICDDYLKDSGFRDNRQAEMSTVQVICIALVAARFFKNCLEHSRVFMLEEGYISTPISQSRLNRRLHSVSEGIWLGLFYRLATGLPTHCLYRLNNGKWTK